MRIPNLETAIEICRTKGLTYNYKANKRNPHIKFFINGYQGFVLVGSKKENPDKVRKDIERHLTVISA